MLTAKTDIRELLETPAPFRAWLEAQPAAVVVGEAGWCGGCPLAKFLDATAGGKWFVDASFCQRGEGELTTPRWAVRFMVAIDRRHCTEEWFDDDEGSAPVFAAAALACLAEVERELAAG